ncbi:MAG TPA: hypothetical protein VJT31_41010 [Rugosimonospora sp.]|nr:hypothetical protein [Rugosimonospora sp.]
MSLIHEPLDTRGRLDGRTAAGLALGVAGLFLFNIICGPYAIALGISGYRRTSSARSRTLAVVSILLGVADLAVLAVLAVTRIHSGGFTWYLN